MLMASKILIFLVYILIAIGIEISRKIIPRRKCLKTKKWLEVYTIKKLIKIPKETISIVWFTFWDEIIFMFL
jgi:hypothetical protein